MTEAELTDSVADILRRAQELSALETAALVVEHVLDNVPRCIHGDECYCNYSPEEL